MLVGRVAEMSFEDWYIMYEEEYYGEGWGFKDSIFGKVRFVVERI